jgi:glycosyltransferase involved in cell wall biosynthesis
MYSGNLSFYVADESGSFVYEFQGNKGLYDAMNKAISLASGDYLCFLNAGDCFHEDDTLQQMVHSIHGNVLPDVIYGETAIVDKDRHFLHMRRLSTPEKQVKEYDVIKKNIDSILKVERQPEREKEAERG